MFNNTVMVADYPDTVLEKCLFRHHTCFDEPKGLLR
jgi:hypothetical protein